MIYVASSLGDASTPQLWLLAVASVGSALTPFMAYKFRDRRARRPKTPHEKLYMYYENYIDRLEEALVKKDVLIDKLYQQIRDQRDAFETTIRELQDKIRIQLEQLDNQQEEIERMKKDVSSIRTDHNKAHAHIEALKSKVVDNK